MISEIDEAAKHIMDSESNTTAAEKPRRPNRTKLFVYFS